MDIENKIKAPELTQVVGGVFKPHVRRTLDVFVAAKWLMLPENFIQLSVEDQAAFMEHATESIWLENFLNEGAKAGIEIIRKAREAGLV